MSKIRLCVAALAAILLTSAAAAAQTAETPPAELVSALFASWGQWSVVAGLGLLLAVQAWRKVHPQVWDQLHPALKRLLPPTVSALTTGAVGLAAGGTWTESAQVFVVQWVTLAWAADILTGLVGKGKVAPTAEVKPLPANARRRGGPPIPPAAAMLFLLALGAGGCSVFRPAVNAVDSVCAMGLEDQPLVQALAAQKGWPIEQTASWLCGFTEVYDAWESALRLRQDPAAAAVREAQRLGLL